MTALFVYLAALALVIAVTLYFTGRRWCVNCGRRCEGRMAGGTVDRPLCWRCAP